MADSLMTDSKPDQMTRKSVTLPVRLWEEIATYRHANRINTEAEAIRRLLLAALNTPPPTRPRGKPRE